MNEGMNSNAATFEHPFATIFEAVFSAKFAKSKIKFAYLSTTQVAPGSEGSALPADLRAAASPATQSAAPTPAAPPAPRHAFGGRGHCRPKRADSDNRANVPPHSVVQHPLGWKKRVWLPEGWGLDTRGIGTHIRGKRRHPKSHGSKKRGRVPTSATSHLLRCPGQVSGGERGDTGGVGQGGR